MKPALTALLALLALAPAAARAQESHAAPQGAAQVDSAVSHAASRQSQGAPAEGAGHGGEDADIITPHITDSHHLEIPLDLSPTKHVVMLLLAATLCAVVLITAAVAHRRHTHQVGRPKGFAAGIEAPCVWCPAGVPRRRTVP